MLIDLAGGTHLNSEVVLLALHVAVDVVARHVGHAGAEWAEGCVQLLRCADEAVGNGAHDGFEGADALVEFALAAAAGH